MCSNVPVIGPDDTGAARLLRNSVSSRALLIRPAATVLFGFFIVLQSSVFANAQNAPDPAEVGEEETQLLEEEDVEEKQTPIESFLFAETSRARSRVGDLTSLRSTSLVPRNILRNVSRPDSVLRLGSFRLEPTLGVSTSYDDNVDASDSERDEEVRGNVTGSLRAQSQFDRHSLGAEANVVSVPYGRDDGDEIFDWSAALDGRLDLTSRSTLSAALAGTYGTEDTETAEAVESINATGDEATVAEIAGTVTYAQQIRRFGWSLSGGIDYIDAEAEDDDLADVVDQRDSTIYSTILDLTYGLSRRLGVFGELGYDYAEFSSAGEGGSRDSQTVEGAVGFDYRLGRTLRTRVGVGSSTIFFEDPLRDTVQSVTAEVTLDGAINLDNFTVLNLSFDQLTDRTTVEDASLVTTSTLRGAVSRELGRNSAVEMSVEGARRDFLDLNRTDYDVNAQLAFSHALTRSLSLNASYRFSQRFSNDDEDEFYRNIVSVGVLASF